MPAYLQGSYFHVYVCARLQVQGLSSQFSFHSANFISVAPRGVFHLEGFSGKAEWSIYQRSTAKKLKLLLLLHLPPELDW